jgi:NADPH:quinone reductase-like Zn-dependent oxidoreductase
MRAIVRTAFGGPEVLTVRDLPAPQPEPGHVLIEVKAFGINQAETHMRKGDWPEAAPISGIECVGLVRDSDDPRFRAGDKVVALMGGMGRSRNGSYAEFTAPPASNVLPITTDLPWEELAAIPESYATAWICIHRNLALAPEQTLLIRGATSSLGQAALNIAAHAGARVIATTRKPERAALLRELGAEHVVLEEPGLSRGIRDLNPDGVDCVLELVGNSTLLDSLALVRPDGRLCLAGFLGGLEPLPAFNPMMQMPSGVHFSFFGSFVFGARFFPLEQVPMQMIVERAAAGIYKAKPARIFNFDQIGDAHRAMEAGTVSGKLVVRV